MTNPNVFPRQSAPLGSFLWGHILRLNFQRHFGELRPCKEGSHTAKL
jgi:hypothetical protein